MEDSNPLSFNRTEILLSLIVFTKFYSMGIISLGLLEGFEFALHTCVHFLLFVNQSHCISAHSSRGFLSHVINSNEDIWLIEKREPWTTVLSSLWVRRTGLSYPGSCPVLSIKSILCFKGREEKVPWFNKLFKY